MGLQKCMLPGLSWFQFARGGAIWCITVAPHYYSSTGFEPCTPCPEGSYALANGSTTCTNCNTSSTNVPTSICPIVSTTSEYNM